jgi:hypothetical protein
VEEEEVFERPSSRRILLSLFIVAPYGEGGSIGKSGKSGGVLLRFV